MQKKEGFWVRLWMKRERSFETEETYVYLNLEDGYDKNDEQGLKSFAEDWAYHDQEGYSSEYYRYGFDVLDKPPKEWLEKELIRLREEQEYLKTQENLVRLELTEGDN